ncbi:MAG: endonuclease/exonuclease/phosphatase family protein [Verrucomicrobia bacterium]|nr:endonuclease/exonuclease/phosphatase family protein [Verrucomicrobiota bacterium]
MRHTTLLSTVLPVLTGVLALALGTGCHQAPSALPGSVRVLSYNIHHGEGTDGKLDLDRIATVIRSADPDLVAVQEVDQRTTRTGGVDQTAALAERTGMHAVFGKAMDFSGGAYGQAVLSRWRVETSEVFPLPGEPGREPRIALLTRVRPPGSPAPLWFVSTHFDHERGDLRVKSAEALMDRLRTLEGPVILAGDFNATPESRPLQILQQRFTDAATGRPEPTIPAEVPDRRIDFVLFAPGDAWRVVETAVLPEALASDHRPVRVTLQRTR